jgi:hypothetical protein
VALVATLIFLVVLLVSGAVTDSAGAGHVWALIGFVLAVTALVVQVTLMVRRRRRNRTVLRIEPAAGTKVGPRPHQAMTGADRRARTRHR